MQRIDFFTNLPAGTIGAEIGVYQGAFSEQILRTGVAKLHLIDCWTYQDGEYSKDPSNLNDGAHQANYREVQRKFDSQICSGRVTIHRKFSNKAVDDFAPGSLDWVYIDADHTYQSCLQDLIRWANIVKLDGSIFGHDYVDNKYTRAMGFGVIEAVQAFCADYGWKLCALTDEDWPSYQLKRQCSP
jgi:methyltransferase family protein